MTSSTALLLIDLQRAIDHPSWGRRNNPQAEANIARLLRAWRGSRRPVIQVRHLSTEPGSTYRPGQSGVELKPGLDPLPGESDATFTFDRRDFNGVPRAAEEVHAMSLVNLQGEHATVLGTGEVLARCGTGL